MSELVYLFKSKDVVVLDKAPGISIHNDEDGENLLNLVDREYSGIKIFPVHRLDKETSGVQILALNEPTAKRLAEAFEKRTVKKIYTGILRGQFVQKEEGIWNAPISDKAEGRDNPAGPISKRVESETHFRVTLETKYFSVCEFDLKTGRQHQIRKHAALVKHPIVGDMRYGDRQYNSKIVATYGESRMFLHCSEIEILGQSLKSPLPAAFEKLMKD